MAAFFFSSKMVKSGKELEMVEEGSRERGWVTVRLRRGWPSGVRE